MDITDDLELAQVENTFATLRSFEMAHELVEGNFDLPYLQMLHRRLFGDVYEWAGEIRTVDISRGDTRFANFSRIGAYAPSITRPLANENFLRGLDVDAFSERAGYYYGELNVLHPFREGNGRSLREFIVQLARGAGYNIDWPSVDRRDTTRACIDAVYGNSKSLAELIRSHILDLDREKAIQLAKVAAGAGVHVYLARPGNVYEGKVIGTTERYVVQAQGTDMVLHARRALLDRKPLASGEHAVIRYPHGNAGIVERQESGLRPIKAGKEAQRRLDPEAER